jgi:hypothetical protein
LEIEHNTSLAEGRQKLGRKPIGTRAMTPLERLHRFRERQRVKRNETKRANFRSTGAENNEWYTPTEHIELARQVLGEIDLDPASNAIAQQRVRATRFFTKDDDGLSLPWQGRVWLNPPYSRNLMSRFVDKLLSELDCGRVTEAIVLTNNTTDPIWFHRLSKAAAAQCFPRGRIKFLRPDGTTGSPAQGQVFHFLGENVERFHEVFGELGFVAAYAGARQ